MRWDTAFDASSRVLVFRAPGYGKSYAVTPAAEDLHSAD